MILLYGVAAGLAAGLARALITRRPYAVPELRWPGLLLVAFLPQLVAFNLPVTRASFPDQLAPFALVSSQVLLLVWVLANIKKPVFWLLALGLILNLVVILANGGLMPIQPEMVMHLYPDAPPDAWSVGERLRVGKDIVLPARQTRLWFLSDRFTLPDWSPFQFAFSLGDVLLAVGAVWILWRAGAGPDDEREGNRHGTKVE